MVQDLQHITVRLPLRDLKLDTISRLDFRLLHFLNLPAWLRQRLKELPLPAPGLLVSIEDSVQVIPRVN